jgi:hypothetical protein
MSQPGIVTTELKIDLRSPKDISRIDVALHTANQNSAIQVTPFYSLDNYSWSNLPTNTFSVSLTGNTSFRFTPVSARYIKLQMTKNGHDLVTNNLYLYEFGLDSLSLYQEGFSDSASSTLYSKPLYVKGPNDEPVEFGRVALEVCEDVPTGTSINYYIAAFDDPSLPVSGNNFIAIDPISRTSTRNPTSLDFGDLSPVTVSGLTISYDSYNSTYTNPSLGFSYLQSISGGVATTVSGLSGNSLGSRYSFYSSNDRILSLSLSPNIEIAKDSLEVWRNIHIQGSTTKVRGEIQGWRFEDPYYKTTVEVSSAVGVDIDWGSKAVVVGGAATKGKSHIAFGTHTLWVHKDSWKFIDMSSVSDLATLKIADPLYPYNHRYLVEGLSYPGSWSSTTEKIYRGFDVVAEYKMQEVSIFDLIHNLQPDDYSHFARDLDSGDTSRYISGAPATGIDCDPLTIFAVKINENVSDSLNELFVIKFKTVNQLYKYLRFKAVLTTTDSTITPIIDSYRVKIAV